MKIRPSIPQSLLLFCALCLPVLAPKLAAAAATRPNLVIMLADDYSYRDSGLNGATDIRTPNVDRLARAGLAFDKAYVASPSCAPSRAALLTGLMPARNGAEANHSKPRMDIKKLPAYLQSLGYEVVAFGKVSHYKYTGDYGFDHFEHDTFHDDVAVDAAVQWLRQRKSDKPLCFFVGTNWPHVPWPQQPEGYDPAQVTIPKNHVDTPETRFSRAQYYTAVGRMDHDLGEVYDAAREVLGENTFFLFTADHGAQWPFGKWNCYNDGIHVPLIVSWPGQVAAGRRTDALVSWIDILPTLVDVAGGTPPTDLDGRSFGGVLRGRTSEHRDRLFTTHSADPKMNAYPIRSLLEGDWLYIKNLHPELEYTTHIDLGKPVDGADYFGSWKKLGETDKAAAAVVRRYHQRPADELYNLKDDPWEMTNLAAKPEQAERVAKMRAEVEKWMQEQGDTGKVFDWARLMSEHGEDLAKLMLED